MLYGINIIIIITIMTVNDCMQYSARCSLLRCLHLNFSLQIGLCLKCTYVDGISDSPKPFIRYVLLTGLVLTGKETAVAAPSLQNKTVRTSPPPHPTTPPNRVVFVSFIQLTVLYISFFILDMLVDAFTC
jgi:hypothetical protein